MFITDKEDLKQYYSENRIWQGIPGIAITKKGRIFSTFYSGGIKEDMGNYILLKYSDDDGKTFTDPIAVCYNGQKARCFDPVVWVDPKNRLWLFWAYIGEECDAEYAVVCNDPDADVLVWGEPRIVGHNVMMNKPVVLSTGEWLLPISVWGKNERFLLTYFGHEYETGAFVYKSNDNGKTFTKLGGTIANQRSFDEHMVVELSDGTLMMLIRTQYGIAVSYSINGGYTWTEPVDSGIKGPCSRFYIGKLDSGRYLLINHYNFNGRNNLTALISDDDCKTWKYSLLLDERVGVSYPDVDFKNGYIYVTYDRERGGFQSCIENAYKNAREILFAKITEEDIIAGKIVNKNSSLKNVISKLGKYSKESENPYKDYKKFSDVELATYLFDNFKDGIIENLFDFYSVNCMNMSLIDTKKLDELTEKYEKSNNKKGIIIEIISLIRSVKEFDPDKVPLVERIKKEVINHDDISIKKLSEKLCVSQYYMLHLFKKETGVSILEYKKSRKLALAKNLLINTDYSIEKIAGECGYNDTSYFIKTFKSTEKITPNEYRKLCR